MKLSFLMMSRFRSCFSHKLFYNSKRQRFWDNKRSEQWDQIKNAKYLGIKVAQNNFTRKMIYFDTFTKIG